MRSKVYRTWLSWWIASVLAFALVIFGVLTNPGPTILTIIAVVVGLVLLLNNIPVLGRRIIRTGYWFFEPRAVASIHFLPPSELRAVRRQMSLLQATSALRNSLLNLNSLNVRLVYAETNLVAIELLGFRRLRPASPLSWLFIALQHRIAAGRGHLAWPWLYVYCASTAAWQDFTRGHSDSQ